MYIERAFGPLFGTIAGIGLWLSLLLKSAFSLVGLSAYLYVVVNIDEAYTKAIALLALLLIFLVSSPQCNENIFSKYTIIKIIGALHT